MKKIILIAFIGIVISCKNTNVTVISPNCIETKIQKLKNEPVQNPPAKVWKWKVDGQTYYYITSNCCDQYNYLFTSNCEIVCAPDGGITGKGDGKCPVFTNKIIKTLVWEDKRK